MLELAACATPPFAIVVESAEPSGIDLVVEELLAPLQPMREQLVAITGIGLEPEEEIEAFEARRGEVRAEGNVVLSYIEAGSPTGQRVLFIHGSPGSADEWAALLAEVPRGQLRLAVDRPGFGDTRPYEAVESLTRQAAALRPLLETGDDRGTILVGYSYGGPVALRAALDMPDRVEGLLLIGSAADPAEEDINPLQALLELEAFAELLPDELAHANSELLALRDELAAMAGELHRLRIPVTVIHGLQDTLVPPQNVTYLDRQLTAASPMRVVLIEEGDHFLPWSHVDAINAALGCLVRDVERARRN